MDLLTAGEKWQKLSLKMPGFVVTQTDEYACYSIKLPKGKFFLKAFEPIADMNIAHHMAVFTCLEPHNTKTMSCLHLCSKGISRGIFLWARQAQSFELPADTAFALGDETDALYIGLQIHYAKPSVERDYSGFNIYWTTTPSKYDAGVLYLGSIEGNIIPPKQNPFLFNESCQYDLNATLYPFAYRTHTHDLGRTVFAYHFSNDKTKMIEIGRANPQWPQAFYPVKNKFVIKTGDYLAVQCVYDSRNRTKPTAFWSGHENEMCFFYLMYAIERSENVMKPFDYFYCHDSEVPDLFSKLPKNSSDYLPDQIPTNYFPTEFVKF